MSYKPVDPNIDFRDLEEGIVAYWRERDIFQKSMANREGSPEWVFYEGPPTANGKPGIHHVQARAYKDVFPRFQTMRGRHVRRRAGWDCHGLPVELEIEKELGFTRKEQIEEYGVQEFNRLCRESVTRYVKDWIRLTERIGFWIDLSDAYWTMSPSYVESVWWSLKQLHLQGLLREDYKSVPYCPRCETALSDHELNYPGAYRSVVDPSVYVRLPLVDEDADLLVWTTTPWTLPSNVAAAVNPEIIYARFETSSGRAVILAEPLAENVVGLGGEAIARYPGSELVGRRYAPPYAFRDAPGAGVVVSADFVSTQDGTAVVHIAPAFGAQDLDVGRVNGLPVINLVDATGRFEPDAGRFAGQEVRQANPAIIEDLNSRGLLFAQLDYEHNYPHCWRCSTPLIYYAKTSWFVSTTSRRDDLLAQNLRTSWRPEHIKHGRYGEWLENNVDWALSRNRYWGTPLPIWRCENSHDIVVGSLRELSELAGEDLTAMDPHRPFVDAVEFDCPQCKARARRVPEVIDAWYDSGAMPFAQWGFPYQQDSEAQYKRSFPADFIAEGLDQTRGWFYSLMAISTLLFGSSSYRNVLCLGLIVDKEGRKMSKSLGNVVDPWTVLDTQGADALRYYLFSSGSAWGYRRIWPEAVEEVKRRFLMTLWNTYSFFVSYANSPLQAGEQDAFSNMSDDMSERPVMDRWIVSELNTTITSVTASLEDFDALRASRRLGSFVDDLSNWYLRRSRRRYLSNSTDGSSARQTLKVCLVRTAQMTAPLTPFISEDIYTNLTGEESVHLSDWPNPTNFVDEELMHSMATARVIVSLGRAARSQAGIKVRQPLASAFVLAPATKRPSSQEIDAEIADELNVRQLQWVDSLDNFLHTTIAPNFRLLGPRLAGAAKGVAEALSSMHPEDVRQQLIAGESLEVVADGVPFTLASDEVLVRSEAVEGYSFAEADGLGVVLDLSLTDELRLEGVARDVVRAVQQARKDAGLKAGEPITLHILAEDIASQAIETHREKIAVETSSRSLNASKPQDPDRWFTRATQIAGTTLQMWLSR